MFEWLTRLDASPSSISKMLSDFQQMLVDGRTAFDDASNALLAGTDPESIRKRLFDTDARINEAEIKIRRAIVVHGSVHGVSDLSACLVLMSLVKDAERIGDYAKNLFDLAIQVDSWKSDTSDLLALRDRVSELLRLTRTVFEAQDADQARTLLEEADKIMDHCDAKITPIVRGEVDDHDLAATVLVYRYNKRVAAHASNILTSLVMPVDKLDYFDEPKMDREKQ